MDTTDTGRGGRYHLDAAGVITSGDPAPADATPSPAQADQPEVPAADAKPASRRRTSTSEVQE